MLTEEGSLTFHVGRFTAYGRNIFALASNLVEILEHTDLSAVQAGDIKLPFAAFFVSFGDSLDAALPGPPNRIDGAYVSLPSPGQLQIVLTSRRLDVRNGGSRHWPFSRDLYYYVPCDISDERRTFSEVLDAAVGTEIRIAPEITEPDPDFVAELGNAKQMLVRDVRHLSQAEAAQFNREGLSAVRRALSLVVNGLCYLSAEPQELPEVYPSDAPADLVEISQTGKPSRRSGARAQLLERGFSTIRIVGGDVPDPKQSLVPGDGSVRPHWRRGHWRRQPYGPGLASTRLIRIAPTLVRSDLGEPAAGHFYQIDARPTK
jgi:hypothetical protein